MPTTKAEHGSTRLVRLFKNAFSSASNLGIIIATRVFIMLIRCLVLTLTCTLALSAQEPPPRTEIELTATVRKLAIAVSSAEVVNLINDQVQREYSETLRRNLENIQSLAVLRDSLPTATGTDSFQLWTDAGCDWLVASKVSQRNRDEVSVEAVVFDVKSGRRVGTINRNGNTSGYKRLAHMVADAIEEFLTGTPGIAYSRIIFCREDSPGVKEIYQADRDGSNIIKLTNHKTLTMSPSIARDGRLAYLSYCPRPAIWGQKVVGGKHVRLYPLSDSTKFNVYTPVWSPDGNRIAFVQTDGQGDTDIMLLEVASGRVRSLTGLNGINSEICWNPAGNQIAFASGRDGNPTLYIMEDDGTNVRKLPIDGSYNASPAWSPDGSMIAFVSRFEDNFDLFVYRFGDPNPYQITTGFPNSENPAWSPDSRYLIFSSTREGRNRLYITDLAGDRIVRALELTGCQQPVWVRAR
jgi:TolB protein